MRQIFLLPLILLAAPVWQAVHALQGESIYVKAIAGGAYTMVSETAHDTSGDISVDFKGMSGLGYLQIGGSLSKSVKFFGFTGIAVAPSPTATTTNLKIDTVYSMQTILDLGVGFAFYSRNGQFLSLGASFAQNYYKFNVYGTDVGMYTKQGWGSQIMLGQEFPIAARYSLGLSAIGYYGQVYDTGTAPYDGATVTNFYAGLAVSLTYD